MTEGFQFKGVEELRANLREISRAQCPTFAERAQEERANAVGD